MIKVENGLEELDRYVCVVCGYDDETEEDVWTHINEEHHKHDLIEFCIEKVEF